MIKSFKDLQVYQESYQLAIKINKNIKHLPKSEKYELANQMKRASRSIPANIAEGWAKRKSAAEFKRFVKVALGSCHEMEVHLTFAKDLNFWPTAFCQGLLDQYQVLGKKLTRLLVNWR